MAKRLASSRAADKSEIRLRSLRTSLRRSHLLLSSKKKNSNVPSKKSISGKESEGALPSHSLAKSKKTIPSKNSGKQIGLKIRVKPLRSNSQGDDSEATRRTARISERNQKRVSSSDLIEKKQNSERNAARVQILRRSSRLAASFQRICGEKNGIGEKESRECCDKKGLKRARSSPILRKKVSKKGKCGVPINCSAFPSVVTDLLLEMGVMNGSRWQHMIPPEILACISDLLPIPDFITFRSICRSWRSAPSSRSNITKFDKDRPWIILYDFKKEHSDDCLLLQLSSKVRCTLKLPGLSGATILVSRAGWLLCHRGNHYFFYNPFSLEKFDLPDYHSSLKPSTKQLATFSTPPTSKDWIAFVIISKSASELEISWCQPSEKRWSSDLVAIGAYNSSLTDEWPCALCCSCGGGGSCKCEHRNKVIIWQSNRWMRYDIIKKELQSGQCWNPYKRCWWSDLYETNLNDLTNKYVEKDVIISFSPFNNIRTGGMSLTSNDYRAAASKYSAAQPAKAKAVWMEPVFPWR